jgi:hypothetical protein
MRSLGPVQKGCDASVPRSVSIGVLAYLADLFPEAGPAAEEAPGKPIFSEPDLQYKLTNWSENRERKRYCLATKRSPSLPVREKLQFGRRYRRIKPAP